MTTIATVPPVKNDKSKKKKANTKVWFWANECKYSVILDNVRNIGWKIVEDERYEAKVNLYWVDVALIHERFRTIQPWQMINHFPGMPNIARKNRMGQNLNKMLRIFPREYAFYPKTWVLPGELSDFRAQFDERGNAIANKIYIIKPDTGCQGRGIFLTRSFDTVPQTENVVAQLYIKKPLLLDGFKFDLRLYCLVSSVKPLRIYLFQDGLVRMCTEEYVKPTKQNLSMVCMHLTNYAVNKHNANFQQPSAKTSEECNDEGSKRSLHWFMNFIREEKGEAKAKWLWKRMGTLCVRTILSIMPILSREYDQHFKSFASVPQTPASAYTGYGANGYGSGPADDKTGQGGNHAEGDQSDGEDDNNDNSSAANGDGAGGDTPEPQPSAEGEDTDGGAGDDKESTKTRGARCFEVLGFDVMIDCNLKPWIIEVNHLPSFGTDSPLDLDIKERLMQQVFQALPTQPDDELAYLQYHKNEAGKRLVRKAGGDSRGPPSAANNVSALGSSSAKDSRSEVEKHRSFYERAKKEAIRAKALLNGGIGSNGMSADMMCAAEGGDTPLQQALTNVAIAQQALADGPQIDPNCVVGPVDTQEGCSPHRMEEIKRCLSEIYMNFSPEKVSKINRLLQKYDGREEEFLRFVYNKYAVAPPWVLAAQDAALKQLTANLVSAQAVVAELMANSGCSLGDADMNSTKSAASARVPTRPTNVGSREGRPNANKRFARSLSPPQAARRQQANWKSTGADEDAAYRQEVLSTHLPTDDDEWMAKEMKVLTQFTRIFPELPKSDGEDDGEDDEAGGDDRDDEDGGAQGQTSSPAPTSIVSGSLTPDQQQQALAKPLTASYEEILYQVFVADKRQTMRLRCPLQSRVKQPNESDANSLPPLENKSHLHGSIAANVGKGVVGWRPPPKQKDEKKEAPKLPTQTQLDAAKRLSQGLSVAQTQYRQKQVGQSLCPPVIMDTNGDQGAYNGSAWGMHQGATYAMDGQANGNNVNTEMWPPYRMSRLIEESRLARQRMDIAKSTPASVLKQQVFRFDSHFDGAEAYQADISIHVPHGNSSIGDSGGGGGGGGGGVGALHGPIILSRGSLASVHSSGLRSSLSGAIGSNVAMSAAAAAAAAAASGVSSSSSVVAGPGGAGGSGPHGTHHGHHGHGHAPVLAQSLQAQANNNPNNNSNNSRPSVSNGTGGSDDPNQEEMLRQLFPGWF